MSAGEGGLGGEFPHPLFFLSGSLTRKKVIISKDLLVIDWRGLAVLVRLICFYSGVLEDEICD